MSGRELIADKLETMLTVGFVTYDDAASGVIDALHAAGYRILAPGEVDGETVERCAAHIECLLPEAGAGEPQDATDRLIDSTRRDDVRAIRALVKEPGR